MEHRTLDQLRPLADVEPTTPTTRRDRLERWAKLLEEEPNRRVRSLREIEFCPASERQDVRADNSALAVAFADPVLRSAGLASDRLGDAVAFFELSDRDAHRILCSCRHGYEREASVIASAVRSVAKPGKTVGVYMMVGAATAFAAPVMLHLFG